MPDFEKLGLFYLGKTYDLKHRKVTSELLLYESKHLTTHAVCVGMTGSGKTGLGIGLLEEAAIDVAQGIDRAESRGVAHVALALAFDANLGDLQLRVRLSASGGRESAGNPESGAGGSRRLEKSAPRGGVLLRSHCDAPCEEDLMRR